MRLNINQFCAPQRLAVEAQHPTMPAPVSPTGHVWRRTSLESQGSGDGGTGSRYRRSFSARSTTGSPAIVRGEACCSFSDLHEEMRDCNYCAQSMPGHLNCLRESWSALQSRV